MKARGTILLMVLLAFPVRAADLGQDSGEDFGFGMNGKLGLGMTLAAAQAPIAALAPAIAPPGPEAAGESVRIAGPYRWKDCLLDISFYFRGSGPEGMRKLQTVLLQTVNDTQQLCFSEMEDAVGIDPVRPPENLLPPSEGRAYTANNAWMKASLFWRTASPALMLFSSAAAIDPRRTLPMVRFDAVPPPVGPVTISQNMIGYDPSPPDISLALAKEAAETALAACHQDRIAIAVGVLGPKGGLKVLLSSENGDPGDYQDGSSDLYDRLRQKAYTVLQTLKPSRASTAQHGLPGGGFLRGGPLDAEKLLGGPGALPIWRGDVLAGVISVDGAWGSREDYDKDEACAQVGIDRIKDRLVPLKKP